MGVVSHASTTLAFFLSLRLASVPSVVQFKKAKKRKKQKDTKPRKNKKDTSPEKFISCSFRSAVPLVLFIWHWVRFRRLALMVKEKNVRVRIKQKKSLACFSCFSQCALAIAPHVPNGKENGRFYDKFMESRCNLMFFCGADGIVPLFTIKKTSLCVGQSATLL
jgi:hypothetical protein